MAPTADLLSLRGFLVALLTWAAVQADGTRRIALEAATHTASQRFWEELMGRRSPIGPFDDPELGDAMDRLTAMAISRLPTAGSDRRGEAAETAAWSLLLLLGLTDEARLAALMVLFPHVPIRVGPEHAMEAVLARRQDEEDAVAERQLSKAAREADKAEPMTPAPPYDGTLSGEAVSAIGFELTSCPAPIFPPGLGHVLNPYGRPVTFEHVLQKVMGNAPHDVAEHLGRFFRAAGFAPGVAKQLDSIFRAAGWVPSGEPGHWDVAPARGNAPRAATPQDDNGETREASGGDPSVAPAPDVVAAEDSLAAVSERLADIALGGLEVLRAVTEPKGLVLLDGDRRARCAAGAKAIQRLALPPLALEHIGSLPASLDALANGSVGDARIVRGLADERYVEDGPGAVLADTWRHIPWQHAAVLPDGQVALVMPQQGGGGGNASFLLIGYERTRTAPGAELPPIHLRIASGPWRLQTPSLAEEDEIYVRPGTFLRFLPPAVLGAGATITATLASSIVLPDGPAPAPLQRWGFRLLGVVVPAERDPSLQTIVAGCMTQAATVAIATATASYHAHGGI